MTTCPTCGQPVRVGTAPEPLRTGERVECGPRIDGVWLPAVVLSDEVPGLSVCIRWEDDTLDVENVPRSRLRRVGGESE